MIRGISRKKEVDRIFLHGKVRRFSFGRAYLLQREEENVLPDSELRLVVLVRKKLGKAVKRNRARRIVREALRNLLKSTELKRPLDMAIVLNTVELHYSDVLEEMRVGLKSYFERE